MRTHLRALAGTWTCRPQLLLSRHQARKQGRGQPGLPANTAHVPPPLLPLPAWHRPFAYVHYSPLQPPSHKPKTIAGPLAGCSHCAAGRPRCSGKTYCKQRTSADGRPTCTSHRLPSACRSCLFTLLPLVIKFSCIPASDASSSFLLPSLFQLHPPQSQGSTGHRAGWKRATRPLLGNRPPPTPPPPRTGTWGAFRT